MFQLQPASGRKTLCRLWGRGAGPGPSQNSLSNKGLIQGHGAELGCLETRYGSGNGSACPEGADGAVGGGGGGSPGRGGQGAAVGTFLCAGRLQRAPLTARCGCDVSVEGRSRRTAAQRLPPAQALSSTSGGELQAWGGAGAFLTLTQNLPPLQACSRGKWLRGGKGGQKPHFCISHFLQQIPGSKHCSLHMPQIPAQSPTVWPAQETALVSQGDMPSRAPGQGRVELRRWCCGQQLEQSPVLAERPLPTSQGWFCPASPTEHRNRPSRQDQGCLLHAPLREEAGALVPALLPAWEGRQQRFSKDSSAGWARLEAKPWLLSLCPASFPACRASGFEGAVGSAAWGWQPQCGGSCSVLPPPAPLCPSPAAPSPAIRLFHL